MTTFTNAIGTEYELHIDATSYERARTELGIDLYNLNAIAALNDDLFKTTRLVHCLSNATETFEEFSRDMNGDALESAGEAFTQELLDFLPSRISEPLRAVNSETEKLIDEAVAKLQQYGADVREFAAAKRAELSA